MNNLIGLLVFIAVWVVLQKFVFPRLGMPT
jgi:hypothetical protein